MAQLDLWDRSNVVQAAWEQAAKRSQTVRDAEAELKERLSNPLGQKVRAELRNFFPEQFGEDASGKARSENTLDGHISKFCQLAGYARLTIDHAPDEAELHHWGLEIERDAVHSLREADTRTLGQRIRREARAGFDGTSIDDVVRYVVKQTFRNLDAEFQKKSPAEQEKIAEDIAAALRDLPPEEQSRLRRAAGVPDLTAATLRQTGVLASLGLGVYGLVGIAGFSAYTTLVSVVAGVAGLVGIHLSFSTYIALTSTMAGLANPFLFVPMIAGGGAWMTSRANRSIRGALYPALVATSVMAHAAASSRDHKLNAFHDRLAELVADINAAKGMRSVTLLRQFPGLGKPPLAARIASHAPI